MNAVRFSVCRSVRLDRRFCHPLLLGLAVLQSMAWGVRGQGTLTNGWTHTGTIAPVGDVDVWTFTGAVGENIVLRIGEITQTNAFIPRIRLINPASATNAASGSVAAEIAITTTNAGLFTVLVDDLNGTTATGTYRLTMIRSGNPVLTGPGDQGGPMTNGIMHLGSIETGDLDVWTVAATNGQSVVLRMGETNNVVFAPQLRVYDPSGKLLQTDATTVGAEVAFTATNSGNFLVVAGDFTGSFAGSGSYRLTLAKTGDPVQVSPGDEGGPMTNGIMQIGIIETGDLDVWTVAATNGQNVVIRMGETNNVTFSPQLRVYDPSGVLLDQETTTVGAEVSFRATNSGTFLVIASDFTGSYAGSGPYRLTLAKTGDPVQVSSGDEGGPMTNGLMHTATIGIGDLDVWTVEATNGQSVVIRMGETNNVTFSPQLRVYDPSGVLLDQETTTVGAEVSFRATNSGTFLVIASDFTGSYAGSGPYRMTLAETGVPVFVSPGDEGGPMTNGIMHTGTIDIGDLDLWTVTAAVGQSVVIRMGETNNVTFAPQLRVYDPSGVLLDQETTTVGTEVSFRATNSGTFMVIASDFTGSYAGSGPYRLTLAETGVPVFVSPGDEGGPMTNGIMHTGTIDIGDLDLWTVTATAGQSVVVRMGETNPLIFAPQLRIYDPSGIQLDLETSTVGAEVSFRATNSGTFLLIAGDFSGSYAGAGPYRLTLAKTGDSAALSLGDEGGPMDGSGSYDGTIPFGDLDVFYFTACAGDGLVLKMEELVGGSTLSPSLRLYGGNGTMIDSKISTASVQISTLAPMSGTYLVVAGDGAGSYSGTGTYRLTVNGLSAGIKLCLPDIAGTNLSLTGIGGSPGTNTVLVTATNLAAPVGVWTPIATNVFDIFGVITHTNIFDVSEPQRYFRLELP